MGKKSNDPPPAPDPVKTASSQGAANRDAAIAQGVLNMTNQRGPDGSLTYNKLGEETFTDSLTGKTFTIPRYEAVQEYSPQAQARINQQNEFDTKTNQLAIDQTDRLKSLLSNPVSLNNEATEKRIFDLATRRLNPRFAEDEEALRTRLANQGIRAGSVAYDSEMRRFGENKNDALNQLLLQGRGQAVQEALTERNQPINEITALISGGQVSQPNFVNTPQTALAAPDYQGAVYNSYKGQLDAWRAQQEAQTGLANGLFRTAGAAAMAF